MANNDFTNGMIAVKETHLLGEKLLRFPEMTAEEVLRILQENGFGGGQTQETEALCAAEEDALDLFIRAYAPSQAERSYLLSPRDFHNAKALYKAYKEGVDGSSLLAPEGCIPVATLSAAIESGDVKPLGKELGEAVRQVLEDEELGGAEIGAIFDRALYCHLSSTCRHAKILKQLLAGRADRTNILICMRAETFEQARPLFVDGGKLSEKQLSMLFDSDMVQASHALDNTAYADFCALCFRAKERKLPYTEAERALESFEAEYFFARRYELEGKEPFLYYVFRRRAEIQNVRVILVCLNAGLAVHDIRRRLRAV